MKLSTDRRIHKALPLILTTLIVLTALFIATRTQTIIVEVRPLLTGTYIMAEVTAYSSEVEQTDDTPFIMASNKHVYNGAIANNCLDFGTVVIIKDKFYIVEDRLNKRYDCNHYDIWFENTSEAWDFGRQELIVEIIE